MEKETLIKQIQDSVVDMMSKVNFDEKKHRYTSSSDGSWLQGVSTISSIIPKDWLSAWGAKETVKDLGWYDNNVKDLSEEQKQIFIKKAEEELLKIKSFSINDYLKRLKEAKGASSRKSKDSLVDGKEGHEWLEKYIKAKIRNTELPIIPEGNLKRPIEQFLEWESKEIDYWILSEARVSYIEKGYAGILDAMAILKSGKLAIIDFKFASSISEDYYLQTAGYAATFEPYGINVDERIIIRLPKTLTKEEWDNNLHQYKIIENNIEVKYVKTSYELDRDTFFHCIPVKKWINQFTS